MKKHNVDILAYDSNTAERSQSAQHLVESISLTGNITPYRNTKLYSVMGHQHVEEFLTKNAQNLHLPDVSQILHTIYNKMYIEPEGDIMVLHDIYSDLQQEGYEQPYNNFISSLKNLLLSLGGQVLTNAQATEIGEGSNSYDIEFIRAILGAVEAEENNG